MCHVKNQLISDAYRELNRKLHGYPYYGVNGRLYAERIRRLSQDLRTRDILDYGCGKRTLEAALEFQIRNYDPGMPGLDSRPEPADIVACIDVLAHIEPELLDNVLDDLQRVTKRLAFLYIGTRPGKKTLADRRNAGLIQQPVDWWLPKLAKRFAIKWIEFEEGAFIALVGPPRMVHFGALELARARHLIPMRAWLRVKSKRLRKRLSGVDAD